MGGILDKKRPEISLHKKRGQPFLKKKMVLAKKP